MADKRFAMQDAGNCGARSSRQGFSFGACQERRAFVHCKFGGSAASVVGEKIGDDILLHDWDFCANRL